VHGNQVPPYLAGDFYTDDDLKVDPMAMAGRTKFPRVGAFEVFHDGKRIFSKLESKQWPSPAIVAARVAGDERAFSPVKRPRTTKPMPLRARIDTSKPGPRQPMEQPQKGPPHMPRKEE
jgi:hypothetical protein